MKKSIFKKGIRNICIKTVGDLMDLLFKSEVDFDKTEETGAMLTSLCDVVKTKSFCSDLYDEIMSKVPAGKEDSIELSKSEFIEMTNSYFVELADKLLSERQN